MRAMAAAELEGMRAGTRGGIAAAHAELESARRLAALYRTTVLPQAGRPALLPSAGAAAVPRATGGPASSSCTRRSWRARSTACGRR